MRILPLALLMAAAACSEPPLVVQDQAPPIGVADVAGRVLDASGAPLAGTVSIECAGGQFGETVPISAEGHYHASLVTATRRVGESLRLPCVFAGPAGTRVERTIGFGPPGLPHALQIVDLRGS
jgi:hypothetical protein